MESRGRTRRRFLAGDGVALIVAEIAVNLAI